MKLSVVVVDILLGVLEVVCYLAGVTLMRWLLNMPSDWAFFAGIFLGLAVAVCITWRLPALFLWIYNHVQAWTAKEDKWDA